MTSLAFFNLILFVQKLLFRVSGFALREVVALLRALPSGRTAMADSAHVVVANRVSCPKIKVRQVVARIISPNG